jgi:DNA-binding PadR family transcriptional regulator
MADNSLDTEIKAMQTISTALQSLEPDAVRRVLKWANERFQIRSPAPTMPDYSPHGSENPPQAFNEFSDLFDAANPMMDVDKALLAAYWFQVVQKHDDLDSLQLNTELKHLGHPSGNITRALDNLINRSPRLVMQTRKDGTTKQARKRYKLTREGIRAVEKMIANPNDQSSIGSGNGGQP